MGLARRSALAMWGCLAVGCVGLGDDAEVAGAGEAADLACGQALDVAVLRLNFFDGFGGGDVRGTLRFRSAADQAVTIRASASYEDAFGINLSAWDAAGHEAEQNLWRGRSATVRFWADAGSTLKVLTWPYRNHVDDGTDYVGGRYVSREKEARGTYRITVQCGGPVACEVPEGTGACGREASCAGGRRIGGPCPGPRDVQCCVPAAAIPPIEPAVPVGEPPACTPGAVERCGDCGERSCGADGLWSLCSGACDDLCTECLDGDGRCCCDGDADCWI